MKGRQSSERRTVNEKVWKLRERERERGMEKKEVSEGCVFERKMMSRLQRVCVSLLEGF